jgi:hypothetical protein
MMFEPELRRAWVLKGRPCENEFHEVTVSAAAGART